MTIAFDEAGNTGANLLDKNQRIFSLASVNFTDEEAKELTSLFTTKSDELHFVNLRKRNKVKIIEFLNHDLITNSKVKYALSDKRFALICRLVDYLMEPVFFSRGINLYQDGSHMATANMLYVISITHGYEDKILKMLALFQKMMREKSENSINTFYDFVKSIKKGLLGDFIFEIILLSRSELDSVLNPVNKYSLDPTYSAFTSLTNLWYYELNAKFDILHDNSKQVEFWKEMIEFFSNENLHQKTEFPILAGDKATYPLQINTLNLEDSKNSLQIQIADIVASSLTFALNKKVKGEENEFTNEILNSKIFGFESSHYLFPSTDVDPESLGTKGTQNDESINHIVSMMTKNNEAYNSISDKLD